MGSIFVVTILGSLIVWMGLYILSNIPTGVSRNTTPKPVQGDFWQLSGKVTSLGEDSFQIHFADYWTLSRPFTVFLDGIISEDLGNVQDTQIQLTVFPMGDGFDREAFGRCAVLENYQSLVIHIPYLVARHLLEDLRARSESY